MRIAFYGTLRHWPWAAPDYVWPRAARKFLQRGDRVLVLAPEIHRGRPELQELQGLGATIQHLPEYRISKGRLSALRNWVAEGRGGRRKLRRTLWEFAPEVVFINQGAVGCALAEPDLLDHLATAHPAYVLFCRSNQRGNPMPVEQRAALTKLFQGAEAVLFNSRWMLELTERQLMTALPNGGIFPHLVRFEREEPLPWPATDVPRLASVSRFDVNHKGLDVLLEAVALLKAEGLRFRLDLHGYGPHEAFLREYIAYLGVGDMAAVRGRAEDVREVWRESELLVLTSRYEGLAVSMLEAMACGRPVLRTAYGGAEWLEHGRTGFLIPAAEPVLLADGIRQALAVRPKWAAMGAAAHAELNRRLPKDPERVYLDLADRVMAGS